MKKYENMEVKIKYTREDIKTLIISDIAKKMPELVGSEVNILFELDSAYVSKFFSHATAYVEKKKA